MRSDGYRLLFYHSTRKGELDRTARLRRIEWAVQELREVNARLLGAHTRFRQQAQVDASVAPAEAGDGVFPLLTNDRSLTAEQVLWA